MRLAPIILLTAAAFAIAGCDMGRGGSASPPLNAPYDDSQAWPEQTQAAEPSDLPSGDDMLGAENGVIFLAYDVLAYPGQDLSLVAQAINARTGLGLSGVTVTFYQGGRELGSDLTDRNGVASLPVRLAKAGDYTFIAKITDARANIADSVLGVTPAKLLVMARDVDAKFLVVDLDNTLVRNGLDDVLAGRWALPMDGSSGVVNRLADVKDCTVVYATAQAEHMTARLKDWLDEHDFPPGPVLAIDMDNPGSGRTSGVGDLRGAYPNVLIIGVPGRIAGALSLLDNDIATYLLPTYQANPDEMRRLAQEIQALPDVPQLSVVSSWPEIEAAVVHELRHSPRIFAENLHQLAEEIERRQKRDSRRQ